MCVEARCAQASQTQDPCASPSAKSRRCKDSTGWAISSLHFAVQVACDYRVDGIVCLVDVMHIEQHLDEQRPDGAVNEAVQQVAFADRILINKVLS